MAVSSVSTSTPRSSSSSRRYGGGEAAAVPGLARAMPDRHPSPCPQQPAATRRRSSSSSSGALEAHDREAAALVAAHAQVAPAEPLRGAARRRQRPWSGASRPRPRAGSRPPPRGPAPSRGTRHSPPRSWRTTRPRTGGPPGRAGRAASPRRSPPARPPTPTTSSRRLGPAADAGTAFVVSSPAGVTQRTASHQLVDAPVSGRGLARGARGDPAAERRVLERLREVAERAAPRAARRSSSGPSRPAWARSGQRGQIHVHGAVPTSRAEIERSHAREALPHRLHAPHDARAAAERHDRHAVLRAQGRARPPPPPRSPGTARRRVRSTRRPSGSARDPDTTRPTACATRVSRSSRRPSEPSAVASRSRSCAGSAGLGQGDLLERHGRPAPLGSAPSSSPSRSSAAGESGTACPSSPQPHQRIRARPRAARPARRGPPRPGAAPPRAAGTG